MKLFFQICSLINTFNLAAILRSIALPFVFIYVTYFQIIDSLSSSATKLHFPEPPKAIIHPLSDLYNQLNSLTVKNLTEFTPTIKRAKKAQLIEAYLITH